jgi:hypothetical protein
LISLSTRSKSAGFPPSRRKKPEFWHGEVQRLAKPNPISADPNTDRELLRHARRRQPEGVTPFFQN